MSLYFGVFISLFAYLIGMKLKKKFGWPEVATSEVKETGLPESNVLYYDMNDGAWLCIRPSGTEPKIKFYYGVKGTSLDDAEVKSKAVGDELMGMVDKMM